MNDHAMYRDVVADVTAELRRRAGDLIDCGVGQDQIMLDPGLGFAKRPPHDWALLGHLGELRDLGFPLLVGASRKSFLGAMLAEGRESAPAPATRDMATAAVSALAAAAGAYCVRVHDVPASLDAVRVAAAWRKGAADAIPGGVPGP
jgi:dihydropteroate synthase